MKTMKLFQAILADTRGATAIEYGLIVAMIVIAIMVSVQSVADESSGLWAVVRENVDTAM